VNADALAPLLLLQGATNIHDAHEHAVDAVKAGATSEEVSAAIGEWMQVQARQVQQVFASPPRCRCSHGPSHHTAGLGKCHIFVCACATYRDPAGIPARLDERYDPSPEPIDRSIQ